MNIPAVIGVGDEFLPHIENGETIIVDGFTGEIYVDPDEAVLNAMMKKQSEDIEKKKLLLNLKGKENITIDGTKIDIFANIGGVANIGAALFKTPEGSGFSEASFCTWKIQIFLLRNSSLRRIKKFLKAWLEKRL